jgi:hypothetical protein
MRGKNVHLALEGFDDELNVLSRHTLNGFLHYVIAVLIFDALQDIDLQLFHQLGLLISEDVLQGLMAKC